MSLNLLYQTQRHTKLTKDGYLSFLCLNSFFVVKYMNIQFIFMILILKSGIYGGGNNKFHPFVQYLII